LELSYLITLAHFVISLYRDLNTPVLGVSLINYPHFYDALGVGDHIHNFVYRFAPWHDLGCWRDTGDGRTMTLLANFRGNIDWFHMEKTGRYE